ncbi:MAG: glycosyltransferase [Candidatus Hydrogenedentes bacterium]|nr:glycosyltransferase [Candidatus Hydrogenedentota bacterium]
MGYPKKIRILTFNFHEPYMCLLAKTGFEMELGLYKEGILSRTWKTQFRPKPENLIEIPEEEWRDRLKNGYYDILIAHNELNAWDLKEYTCPKLLVCHNRKTFLKTILPKSDPNIVELFEKNVEVLAKAFALVFISYSKQDDYNLQGYVVPPGIDVDEYGGYTGEIPKILRVGNYMYERNWMFDVPFQEAVCAGLPNQVIGENPQIPNSTVSTSFEELLNAYRKNRCYLHVTRQEFEDGYNLAMLEAMACGMPVVALKNYTSPITNGVDGFSSFDPAELREYLELLLEDEKVAREIGERGRETVKNTFPIGEFVDKWQKIILTHSGLETNSVQISKPPNYPKRYRILLDYVSSPYTTGRYLEYALQEKHDVVSIGFRCPEELLERWGFLSPYPPYPPPRIPTTLDENRIKHTLEKLPNGYNFEFYLYVDSGLKTIDPELDAMNILKIAYFIDTHLDFKTRLEMARHFDIVFLAQKSHVELFKLEGIRYVYWLPLACYPELYPKEKLPRDIDVAYVGSLSHEEGDKRIKILKKVADKFPNHFIGKSWPREMARIYSRSKIVVNSAINYDLNMRVFEALASGALLVTDPADSINELFEDGKEIVVYHSQDELLDKIKYYLENEDEREKIAQQGKEKVLKYHTYHHRVEQIVKTIEENFNLNRPRVNKLSRKPIVYYSSQRWDLLPYIPQSVKNVLDIGCGVGLFGKALKDILKVSFVAGVETEESIAKIAEKNLDKVICGNIEEIDLPFEDGFFDLICFCDVLEHLISPFDILKKIHKYLANYGYVLISIPNIRYWGVIAELSNGEWRYQDSGILDITHISLLSKTGIRSLLKRAGYLPILVSPINITPESYVPKNADGSIRLGKLTILGVSERDYEDIRAYQYVAVAQKIPTAEKIFDEFVSMLITEKKFEYLLELSEVKLEIPDWKKKTLEAKFYAHTGNLVRAQEIYTELLKSNKENPKILLEYGILLVAMGQGFIALKHLHEAEKQIPKDLKLKLAIAQAYLQVNNLEKSFEYFYSVYSNSYEYIEILPLFVSVCESLGKNEIAKETLDRFSKFYPSNVRLIIEYSRYLVRQNNKSEAINLLKEFVELFGKTEEIEKELDTLEKDK